MSRKHRRLQDKLARRANKKDIARQKLDKQLDEYTQRVENQILNMARNELLSLGFGQKRMARFEKELDYVRLVTKNGETLVKSGETFDGFIHNVKIPSNEKYRKEVELYTIGCERRMLSCVKKVLQKEFGFGKVRLQRFIVNLNERSDYTVSKRTST